MPDIQWDSQASLMRVYRFKSTDAEETLVGRGTLRALVGLVLAMGADEQQGLMLRAAGPDWVEEFDSDAIRELAARPEYTGVDGEYDSVDRDTDAERTVDDDAVLLADHAPDPEDVDDDAAR